MSLYFRHAGGGQVLIKIASQAERFSKEDVETETTAAPG
jgi:hypothetical protein